MGSKSKARSNCGARRSKQFMARRMKEKSPPKGKGGGEEGNERGRISEEKTSEALRFMKDRGEISDFIHAVQGSEMDRIEKADFVIFVKRQSKKKPYQRLPLQVKSSEKSVLDHRKKSSVPAINVTDNDSVFDIKAKVESVLNLS